MAARDSVKLGPFNIPPRLKGKIAKRVETKGSSLNDVVVSVLARNYGIEFVPSGRRSPTPLSPYHRILLDVPAELAQAVRIDAAKSGDSQRNVVVRLLSDEFRVPFEPTARWPRRRAAAASS